MRLNKLLSGLMAAALLAAGSMTASAAETMRISSWIPPHAMNKVFFPEWIAAIEKASGGNVTGKVEFDLAPPPGQLDLVADGAADAAWIFHGYNPGRFVTTKLIELPGYPGDAEAASVADWRTYEKYLAKADEHKGVYLAALFTHGPGQMFLREPINSLDDLKGKKIRIGGGVSADVGAALGVVGVQVPASKVYETLSGGVADGVMLPMETNKSVRVYEVAPMTYIMPGGLYRGSFALIMSNAFLDRLSDADRKAVLSVTGEATSQMIGKVWADADIDGMDNAKVKTKVIEFSADDQAKFAEISKSVRKKVIDEVAAKGVDAEAAVAMIEETMKAYGK
jgi:TRAP-type C4-dicarboxylate transport system substrate-binding protein